MERQFMFTYGTLINDIIRTQVLNKYVETENAVLNNYELTNHSYAEYFVIKKKFGSIVNGVIFEVNDQDIERLDRYENGLYNRIIVRIGDKDCWTYIEKPINEYKVV